MSNHFVGSETETLASSEYKFCTVKLVETSQLPSSSLYFRVICKCRCKLKLVEASSKRRMERAAARWKRKNRTQINKPSTLIGLSYLQGIFQKNETSWVINQHIYQLLAIIGEHLKVVPIIFSTEPGHEEKLLFSKTAWKPISPSCGGPSDQDYIFFTVQEQVSVSGCTNYSKNFKALAVLTSILEESQLKKPPVTA